MNMQGAPDYMTVLKGHEMSAEMSAESFIMNADKKATAGIISLLTHNGIFVALNIVVHPH